MPTGRIPPVMDAIRAAAEARSLSRGDQADFANSFKPPVSRNAVSTWLRGLVTPEVDKWSAIEDFLEMPKILRVLAADFYDPNYAKLRGMVLRGDIHGARASIAVEVEEAAGALQKLEQKVASSTPVSATRSRISKRATGRKDNRGRQAAHNGRLDAEPRKRR